MAFIYDLTDTWNNAGISFSGIKINVTDSASAAGSKLLDLQIGSVSKFTVGKTGTVTATGLIESTVGGFKFPDGTTQTTKATVNSVSGTGTVNGLTLTGTVTNSGSLTLGGTLGNITNSQLANSAITINGTSTALGGSISVGTVTSVSGTGTVNGLTLTGSVTTSGSLTLGGTLGNIANSQLTNSAITINGTSTALGGSISVGTVTSVAALTLGTSGTDLTSSVANGTTTPVITLNVPTASAVNRGALSSSDWSTFNAKQAALVSGTNIKTVGGASLLGSGDVGTIGLAYGGTGATTASGARTALGLGTAAVLNAGVAGGVATLDGSGTVPTSQLPGAVLGGLNYQGTWNASTNTPTLASSTGSKGYYYVVSVAGSTNLNGITDWKIGDWAVYDGTTWQKVDNTDAVSSVNGYTGAVVLTTSDVAQGTNLYFTQAAARGSVSAGIGINYDSGTGVITNSAPDQTVALTGAGTTTVTGTYPNFTITSNDSTVGTVTSVAASGGTTGLSFTGSPITTAGTLTLGGTLALANGGTGATTASGARTALELGTAATTNASAYATAAQGAKADTAVQTIASADGSVTITGTTAIDLSIPVTAATNSVLLPVRNTTGATLTKGTAVYISGATGQISTVSKALATGDAMSAQTLGLVTANIANNTNGNVTLIGTISNIDTSSYTDGAQLYLSPTTAGALTATKPYAPQHLVYMAVVEHAHPSLGKLFVKVQNGYEMDELHNVSAQSPANNDGLFYNTTTSLWEKKSIVTALGYTPYNATNPAGYTTNTGTVTSVNLTAGTGISVSGGPVTSSGAITVTNTAPDQVVSLTGAGTTTITGTYPNFTVTSNDSATGTVTSVGGTGTVSGLTLTGSVTTSGNLTLGGTLAVTPSNFASQTANTVLAAPNGAAGVPTFRAIVAADIPTLNQNTTGTASNVTGTVAVGNGGTGATTLSSGYLVKGNGTSAVSASVVYDNGTNVGIGTASPASKLDVRGVITGGDGTIQTVISYLAAAGVTGTLSNHPYVFYANNAERMRLDTSGNLGIGLTPTTGGYGRGLQISGDPASDLGTLWIQPINTNDHRVSLTNNAKNSGVGTWSYFASSQSATMYEQVAGVHRWFTAGTGTANATISFSEAMRIDTSGNVGIGTSSPASKLEVTGDITQTWAAAADRFIGSKFSTTYELGLHFLEATRETRIVSKAADSSGLVSIYTGVTPTERMRIDASGNVGIGTASPGTKLTVAGASEAIRMANATPYLSFYNAAQSTRFGYIQHNGTNLALVNGEAGSLEMYTSNALRATITSAGDVGIGTTSYGGKLTIIPTANPTTASASTNQLAIGEATNNSAYKLNVGYIFTGGTYAGSVQAIGGGVGIPLLLNADGGNVGIGTTSPAYRFDVRSGTAATAIYANSTATTAYSATSYNGTGARMFLVGGNSSGATNGIQFTQGGSSELFFGGVQEAGGAASFVFQGYNGSAYAERMRIDSSGNVGIGTSSPGSALQVNGNIRVSNGTIFTSANSLVRSIQTMSGSTNQFVSSSIDFYTAAFTDNGQIAFSTGTTERMRIDGSGNLLVGQTANGLQNSNSAAITPSAGNQVVLNKVTGSGSGNAYVVFGYAAGSIGSITQSGTTAVLYNTSSDVRLKHDIIDAPEASSLIDAIQVRSFKWNADNSEQRYGFVAQELVTVAPEAVSQPADPDDMMGVDYSKLVPMLVKEIQSLRARVAQLEGN